jgi:hypothetical protein
MSMFYTAVVVAVVGAGVGAYGAHQQAQAAEDTAKYNAQVQRNQAEAETNVAKENVARAQTQARRELAALRAANASNGLAMQGSPLAVLGDTATQLQLEALDIAYAGEARARALQSQASMSLYEGKTRASAIRTNSYAQLASSAAGAAGSYGKSTGFLS